MNETTRLVGGSPSRSSKRMTLRAKTWKVLHYESSSSHSSDFLARMSRITEVFILNLIIVNIGLTIAASMQVNEQRTCKFNSMNILG